MGERVVSGIIERRGGGIGGKLKVGGDECVGESSGEGGGEGGAKERRESGGCGRREEVEEN